MTQPQAIGRCTPEEYLRRERDAVDKHEYYHGEVFAMSGGTLEHSRIIANTIRELGIRLRGTTCGVYDSNLRVRIPRTTLYTYPDVTVMCGPPEFDPLDSARHTVLNPTLLVELLSPSTEAWDRGGKFGSYQQVESLREYVLISAQLVLVETYLRQPDRTWIYAASTGRETTVRLQSLGIEVPLAELYDGVDVPIWSDRQQVE
jgi:Uma2 family endonuclease